MVSRRVPQGFEPNELTRLLEARRRSGQPPLDLTCSDPTRLGLSGVDPELGAALASAAAIPHQPDSKGALQAREAVARYYADRGAGTRLPGATACDPEAVVLTSSTSEAYAHLFRLLCDPGDSVLAPRPSYPLFDPLARLEGIELVTYRLAYQERWHVDLDSIEAAVGPRTKAVLVVAPNNPTGSCLGPDEVTAIETLCEERGLALIVDEVFGDFPWPPRTEPLPSLLGARRVPTFVLSGLSKVCGLPQLKLAWIAAAGPEPARTRALEGLEWIADLFLSVGAPVQAALGEILGRRAPFQTRVRERLGRNLAAIDAFAGQRGGIERLPGEGGWCAVLRTRASGASFSEVRALERGVLIHPGHFYDLDDSCCVVSLLTDPMQLEEGLGSLFDSM